MSRPDDGGLARLTTEAVAGLAADRGLPAAADAPETYAQLVNGTLDRLDWLLEADAPDVGPPRPDPAGRTSEPPAPDDDPYNAWVTRCAVEGAAEGPLAGVAVGLKDSIALAGVELTAGSDALAGFVPSIDAPVAARLLEAGATVVGKCNMEALAFSGAGDLSDRGPVLNPRDPARLAGGSSGGCAAAVAAGDCDVAIGTDQAGSVRIPAAWCGVVGLKPTHGLVPYTGTLGLDAAIDHLGPMARSVADVARTLEAIAGTATADGVRLDHRQPPALEPGAYAGALGRSLDDVSLGVVEAGFGGPLADPGVDETVRAAVDALVAGGASATPVEVEHHHRTASVMPAVTTLGSQRLFADGGVGTGHVGWYWTELADRVRTVLESDPEALPPTVVEAWLLAAHVDDAVGSGLYARARNVALAVGRSYDARLAHHDALVMPTTPMRPFEHDPDLGWAERVGRSHAPGANTAWANLTGHPAISVPCGEADGLPVGLMLVGRRFGEADLLGVADAVVRALDPPAA